MKAAVYYENGGPEVLRYEDVPDPACHPKGVIIRVEAISIEGGDTLNRWRGPLVKKPHIVGYQAAGEIVEIGEAVPESFGLKIGDRVATVDGYGSHASLRPVPARNCWKIPDGLDPAKAAVVPVAIGTAHECLFGRGQLKAGEKVLVQAGAGGVGLGAIQLAQRAGASMVIATASSEERLEQLKAYGLDHGINYTSQDVATEVKRLTEGKGVDVIVDPVGGATLQGSLDSLGYRGRVSLVGQAGRESNKIDVARMMGQNQTLSGVFLGAEIMQDRIHDMIQGLIDDVAKGEIEVVIDKRFPLSEAAEAHRYIESRKAVGRVVMIP